ncbi:MAG TPA: tetratricopeptide repeat protein, partial [Anseongella sp.]|nr:tetratricopeptide repeat protein [Anseongella sp.]
DSYYKLGNFEEAAKCYGKVTETDPLDIDIWLDYSAMLFEQDETSRAISIISEGIKNNPEAAELYYRLVAYLFSDGQYNEALNTLQHSLHTDPEKYELLFEYLPQLQDNKVIIDIINWYTRDR